MEISRKHLPTSSVVMLPSKVILAAEMAFTMVVTLTPYGVTTSPFWMSRVRMAPEWYASTAKIPTRTMYLEPQIHLLDYTVFVHMQTGSYQPTTMYTLAKGSSTTCNHSLRHATEASMKHILDVCKQYVFEQATLYDAICLLHMLSNIWFAKLGTDIKATPAPPCMDRLTVA